MIKLNNRAFYIFIGCIVVFSIISLACGGSTAEQLASAVPPTPVSSQASMVSPVPEQPQVAQPTSTSAPRPTATPEPEPIALVSQGLGQNGQELGYGFIVENPNTHFAYENSQYQIAIYNADGTVVDTDSGYINLILPGQQLGVGGTLYLDEGVTAARIEVQLNAGHAVVSDLSDSFTVEYVTYNPSEYSPQARCVINNPYNKDITNIRVSAILYNDAGEIIGGGFTYLDFLLANGSTGESVSVTSNGNVSRVDIFPTLSGLSELETSEQLPEGASNLVLSKQGFGQDGSSLGFGMIIENPNQGFSIESTMYHVTAYAEDGTVLGVSEGYVDLLLPNQILGVGGDLFLDEGVIVSRIDAQIMQGNFGTSAVIPTFTSENATYIPGSYSTEVTGEIVSPYSKDITYVRVSAIAFNEAGDIIGGGFTYLDFIPANASAAVSVNITISGTPTTVELYASVSGLSDIEN